MDPSTFLMFVRRFHMVNFNAGRTVGKTTPPGVQTPVHHTTKLAQTVVQVLLTTKMAPPQWPTLHLF